ncbi:RNA-directed DNA polymerase, eukaryota, reverse transcriptase zinc-binding domain protein, partial [Tanacetum coccineum]
NYWASVFLLPKQNYIDSRDIYDARLNNNCTINDIINEGRWNWPEEWKSDFVELNQIQVPNLNEDVEDTVICVYENVQERLMTQDRIKIWRPNDDLKCGLCNKCNDSHEHLFFTCEFSKVVWNELQNMLNIRFSDRWNLIISEMIALPLNRNIWSIVRRIVLNAAVYFIWQERNHRLFNNEKRDKETIINLIKEITVMKLMGLRVNDSNTVKEVEGKWKVKLQRIRAEI